MRIVFLANVADFYGGGLVFQGVGTGTVAGNTIADRRDIADRLGFNGRRPIVQVSVECGGDLRRIQCQFSHLPNPTALVHLRIGS